ncbi:hypothetical protein CYFUS_002167 [Cystobacter fuscus]|uniref:Uncharacterized protein n=1 Tax=Cystobacter fuscus TaxID=43 RepID=A0A250IZT1_9BACT|nr:hypothetical protein CYFUS_002167 [Cystobacter fuscus]
MAKDYAIVVRGTSTGPMVSALGQWARRFQALLFASCLVASMSAAGAELRRVRVTLSAEAHSRAEALGPRLEDWKEGVFVLRVVDPGRLVVKAGGVWRLPPMEDIPPEWLEDEPSEPEREDTLEDEAGARAGLSVELAPLPVQVDPARPELLWVPGYASREEIASRLFGDASAAGAFDIEPRAPFSSAMEGLHVACACATRQRSCRSCSPPCAMPWRRGWRRMSRGAAPSFRRPPWTGPGPPHWWSAACAGLNARTFRMGRGRATSTGTSRRSSP